MDTIAIHHSPKYGNANTTHAKKLKVFTMQSKTQFPVCPLLTHAYTIMQNVQPNNLKFKGWCSYPQGWIPKQTSVRRKCRREKRNKYEVDML